MFILATRNKTILTQYKSLRSAKTWGKVIGADHLFVCDYVMTTSKPSLAIMQSYRLSLTATNFWQKE